MKHYQPRKQNPYLLPHHIYYQTLWAIKGYYWLKERTKEITLATPDTDDQPCCDSVSDQACTKGIKLGDYAYVARVIEEEYDNILPEYKQGVWNNIHYDIRYPDDACRHTYSRHKSRFIYRVAVRLGIYDGKL